MAKQQNMIQASLFDYLGAAPEGTNPRLTEDPASLIARRHRQLLLHSFLYYHVGETLIDDATFDEWRLQLVELHRQYPDLASKAPYASLCQVFIESPSGYSIKEKDYPPEIVSTAIHLLYQTKYKTVEDFETFCARRGFKICKQE